MADIGQVTIGDRNGLQFVMEIPGAQSLAVALSRFGDEVSDFSEFWDTKFKLFFYSTEQLTFAGGGGGTWPALSDRYRRWKNQHFPSAPILTLTGAMKASLLAPDATGSIWRPSALSLEVGSAVPYATYHQSGTSRMPARPPLRFAQADSQRVGKLLQEFVVAAWQKRRAAEASAA